MSWLLCADAWSVKVTALCTPLERGAPFSHLAPCWRTALKHAPCGLSGLHVNPVCRQDLFCSSVTDLLCHAHVCAELSLCRKALLLRGITIDSFTGRDHMEVLDVTYSSFRFGTWYIVVMPKDELWCTTWLKPLSHGDSPEAFQPFVT